MLQIEKDISFHLLLKLKCHCKCGIPGTLIFSLYITANENARGWQIFQSSLPQLFLLFFMKLWEKVGTRNFVNTYQGCWKRGGARGAHIPPDFGKSVNPYISTRGEGGQIMHTNYYTPPPPRFSDLSTSLYLRYLADNFHWLSFSYVMTCICKGNNQ